MQEEYQALMQNQTWIPVPYEPHRKVIDCKWVFKTKYNADGSASRLKARVAKGFYQTSGVDFAETFSPVVKPQTIRTVFSIAVTNGWDIKQVDVNNAILNESLDEDVYMRQPEGFEDKDRLDYVCKLSKALYGLKQAPRAWFEKLKVALISWGFTNSQSDTSLFIREHKGHITYALVYVDDILLTGDNQTQIEDLIEKMDDAFSLRILGSVHHFLGIEVTRNDAGMHLCQAKYIRDILAKASLQNATPCKTPMNTTGKINKHNGDLFEDPTQYRKMIGSLLYVTITRPDLAYLVSKLS